MFLVLVIMTFVNKLTKLRSDCLFPWGEHVWDGQDLDLGPILGKELAHSYSLVIGKFAKGTHKTFVTYSALKIDLYCFSYIRLCIWVFSSSLPKTLCYP